MLLEKILCLELFKFVAVFVLVKEVLEEKMKKVITVSYVVTFVFVLFGAQSVYAAPNLAELRGLYPVQEGESWSYSIDVDDDEGKRVERFENGAWTLESYKGGVPDKSARKRYSEYLQDQQAQDERNDPVYFVGRMLEELPELPLLEESATEAIYSFSPTDIGDNAPDGISEHMQARITFDVAKNAITRIKISNTGPIKPQPMVKISKMSIEMLISAGEFGVPKGFLMQTNEQVKGRLMGVKKFEQDDTTIYSNFMRDENDTISYTP